MLFYFRLETQSTAFNENSKKNNYRDATDPTKLGYFPEEQNISVAMKTLNYKIWCKKFAFCDIRRGA